MGFNVVAPGRIPPERVYPAGQPGLVSRLIQPPGAVLLRVVEAGPAAGRPAVLLHGWAALAYSFRHTIPVLAAAGHRTIAIDLPRHRLSGKPGARTAYTPA